MTQLQPICDFIKVVVEVVCCFFLRDWLPLYKFFNLTYGATDEMVFVTFWCDFSFLKFL